jgi:hypothetical protein
VSADLILPGKDPESPAQEKNDGKSQAQAVVANESTADAPADVEVPAPSNETVEGEESGAQAERIKEPSEPPEAGAAAFVPPTHEAYDATETEAQQTPWDSVGEAVIKSASILSKAEEEVSLKDTDSNDGTETKVASGVEGGIDGPEEPEHPQRELQPYDVPSFGHSSFLHDDRYVARGRGRGRGRCDPSIHPIPASRVGLGMNQFKYLSAWDDRLI